MAREGPPSKPSSSADAARRARRTATGGAGRPARRRWRRSSTWRSPTCSTAITRGTSRGSPARRHSPACSASGSAPGSTRSRRRGPAGRGRRPSELVVLDWLRSLFGMPEGTEGVLVSGGSLANITGLIAARARSRRRSRLSLRSDAHLDPARPHRDRLPARAHPRSGQRAEPPRLATPARRGTRRSRPCRRPPPRVRDRHRRHAPIAAPSIRWESSPSCAPPRSCGFTSTAHTAHPRSCAMRGARR